MEPNSKPGVQSSVPKERLLPVTGDESDQQQSPQDQTLVSQLECGGGGGGGGDGGGELGELGDEFGEREDGDEAAEPAEEGGFVLREEVRFEGIEGFGERGIGFLGSGV